MAKDLGLEVAVRLHADSAAAIGICSRTGIGRVRHLAVGQLWIQERIQSRAVSLVKVPGPENPADLLTKHQTTKVLEEALRCMSAARTSGRSGAAPALAADIEPFLSRK